MPKQGGRLRRDKISQQIFDDLKARISASEFVPGQRLPSESVLAEEYGVSRASVRTAIQKLNTLGQVETRVGEGTFVQGNGLSKLMTEVSAVVAHESMTPHVAELREAIEIVATRLAAERASDDDLESFLDRAKDLVEIGRTGDLEAYLAADYEFHLTLSRLSKNPLLEMVWMSIGGLFEMSIRENVEESGRHAADALVASADRHRDLAQSLVGRDATTAVKAIEWIVYSTQHLRDDDYTGE